MAYKTEVYTDFGNCRVCKRSFIFTFSTRRPMYCPDCRAQSDREKSRDRMQRKRDRDRGASDD